MKFKPVTVKHTNDQGEKRFETEKLREQVDASMDHFRELARLADEDFEDMKLLRKVVTRCIGKELTTASILASASEVLSSAYRGKAVSSPAKCTKRP